MRRTIYALTGAREEVLDAGTESGLTLADAAATIRRRLTGEGNVLRIRHTITTKQWQDIADYTAARSGDAWLVGVNGPPRPAAVEGADIIATVLNA